MSNDEARGHVDRQPLTRDLESPGDAPGDASARPAAGTTAAERSIDVVNIIKEYHTEIGVRRVLDNISFRVRKGEKLAILGRNGAGKSTLIQILSGLQKPTSGHIRRGLSMSWPLALGGGFQGEMSGYDNLRFIAKIYEIPLKETFEFVDDFSELGKQLFVPMRFYSDGMRMRLAFALSLAIDFECYLIDEVLLVGDQKFRDKCAKAIFEDRIDRGMILAIHDPSVVRKRCDAALILRKGKARVFDDVSLACDIYETM